MHAAKARQQRSQGCGRREGPRAVVPSLDKGSQAWASGLGGAPTPPRQHVCSVIAFVLDRFGACRVPREWQFPAGEAGTCPSRLAGEASARGPSAKGRQGVTGRTARSCRRPVPGMGWRPSAVLLTPAPRPALCPRNLLVEDDDDFSTISDDVGRERQKQLTLERKRSLSPTAKKRSVCKAVTFSLVQRQLPGPEDQKLLFPSTWAASDSTVAGRLPAGTAAGPARGTTPVGSGPAGLEEAHVRPDSPARQAPPPRRRAGLRVSGGPDAQAPGAGSAGPPTTPSAQTPDVAVSCSAGQAAADSL
ncbi:hypothetical protein J0S82_013546 [Galemys pyrenaicus]|uniref:Uncharacterized protein n=1 Tax=Galemys pyrenaicus TaxID=202257 RepID=A0A8J6DP94_GALPY|nr:hypothetical protein J0S82_013546 [Galemys pyrenaicus]